MKHPSKVVKVGDQVESVVLDVKPRDRRVSLGIKQLASDPFESSLAALKRGDIVTTTVTAITDGGIEVAVGHDEGRWRATVRRGDLGPAPEVP